MGCNPCINNKEHELVIKAMTAENRSESTSYSNLHNEQADSESKDNNTKQSSFNSIMNKTESTISFPHPIECLCQINNNLLAAGHNNGLITIFNINKKTKLYTLEGHQGSICTLKLLSNGLLTSASGDSTIKLWSPLTRQFKFTLLGHSNWVNDIIELNDGRLVSASSDQTIRIWNMNTHTNEFTITSEGSKNCLVQIDDDTIAFNANDSVIVYDIKNKTELYSFPGAYSTVVSLLFLKSQNVLVSGSENGLIRAWNVLSHEKAFTVKSPEMNNIRSMLRISNDVIAVASGINISLWSISSKMIFNTLTGHEKTINGMVLLENNNRIVSCSDDKTVKLWN